MRPLSIWGALALITIAGCTDVPSYEQSIDPEPEAPNTAPEDTQGDQGGGIVRRDPEPVVFSPLHLSDCIAAELLVEFVRERVEEPQPESWDDDWPIFTAAYEAFSCRRIGWDTLERGPIDFVLESAIVVDPPAACLPPTRSTIRFVTAIYSDEPEFGARLAGGLGVEHYDAILNINLGSLTGLEIATIGLDVAGYETSTFSFAPPSESSEPKPDIRVFLAQNKTHSARLVLEGQTAYAELDPKLGAASMREPTMLAGSDLDYLPLRHTYRTDAEWAGELVQWSGLECN